MSLAQRNQCSGSGRRSRGRGANGPYKSCIQYLANTLG